MPLLLDPPPVWVAGNRWSDMPVPELGEWSPTKRVSVVLPYYERSLELSLTLSGLAQQTYPHHLLQVIIADDGSTVDPPTPLAGLPFDVQILRQEDLGYGLARARNLGAKAAEGDVIVFLDCDMIPSKRHIEAHARWHHVARRLVTLGSRLHADFSSATPGDVAQAVRDQTMDRLAVGEIKRPEWIEEHLRRTADLEGPVDDIYLAMSGGNLGIDRDLYWEAGGNDESFTRWGGEDNEFGFRVLQLGAVVVPERSALAWHQGEGHQASKEELEAIRLQQAKLRNLIAIPVSRRPTPGRMYAIPRLLVAVSPGDHPPEVIGLTIDSLLASEFTDLVIGVDYVANSVTQEWLGDMYRAEGRVHLSTSPTDLYGKHPFSPIRMSLPAGHGVRADTIRLLLDQVGASGVGSLRITLPGRPPQEGVRVLLTRAVNRARHSHPDDVERVVGRLFGERWISGTSVGFWVIDQIEGAWARIVAQERVSTDSELEAKVAWYESELETLQSRRALRLVNGLGTLARARTWREFRTGLSSVRGSLRPQSEVAEAVR